MSYSAPHPLDASDPKYPRHGTKSTHAVSALIERGEIDRAAQLLVEEHLPPTDQTTLCWAQCALERRDPELAATLIENLAEPNAAPAKVLCGDMVVRAERYDEHYDLVFAVARSHRLNDSEVGALALQTAELAVLSGNTILAADLFDFAASQLGDNLLLQARNRVGQRVVGSANPAFDAPEERDISATVDREATSPAESLASAAAFVMADRDRNVVAASQLREISTDLHQSGLIDLGRRLRVLAMALHPGLSDPEIGPEELARCPWVTTEVLYRRFDRCPESEFDFWAQTLELRASIAPHSSLVAETSDVVRWSRSIYDQHQQNLALDNAIEQTRSGWRELANLTSNEIRGLLTSLGVAADLRRSGSSTPPGLELALVHRIAALTTMTQLGASEAPSEVERPSGECSLAAELLDEVIAGERPIFEWAQRSLRFTNLVDPDVAVDVNPSAMSDMLRWLLLSATTGSLSSASIEIVASTRAVDSASDDRRGGLGSEHDLGRILVIEILSRTPAPPEPERHRELGLGSKTTAYRAAVMLVRSWDGTFSANYTSAGLDIIIKLPSTQVRSDRSEPTG